MIAIAPYLTAFFEQHLLFERRRSEQTRDSYAYAFKLFLTHASERLKVSPSRLALEQIDAPLVVDFLNALEPTRRNGPSSRNARLAAIKSFMHSLEYRVPSAIERIRQILMIPVKQAESRLVRHLTTEEVQAILDGPDPTVRAGVRDRAMLHLCYAAALRVSELIGLRVDNLALQPHASVLIFGKGRRERCLPLWKTTTAAVRAWLAVRGPAPVPELFVSARGESLTRSGFEYILAKHVRTAAKRCPSLATKRVSPHVLRHSCALAILQATKDLRKVSLWLGHAHLHTTEIYTRVDPSVKLVSRPAPVDTHHNQVGVLPSRHTQNLAIRLPDGERCLDGGGRTDRIAHGARQALTAVSLKPTAKVGETQALSDTIVSYISGASSSMLYTITCRTVRRAPAI